MLQSIRDNSQSIVAKVIVGLIVVTFALFGVESLVSLTGGSNAPATVNGEEIGERELLQGVELQRRQLLAQMGENADPSLLEDDAIREGVLDGLIEQAVLVQSAQNQDMRISDQLIDQLIVGTPDFQLDGKFDRQQFEALLRNAGLTPLTYRALLRKEKLIEQERLGYMMSAFTLPGEAQQVVELDRQTRDLSYFVLPAEPVKATIEISDEELAAEYDKRRGSLMTDEQVVVDYLLLERESLESEVSVTDDELQTQYQTLLENFSAEEQRHAAHILVEVGDQRDDAAAKARAEELLARLQAGEDFATLAQAESDDIGSAEAGGDLGVNGKGVFVPEFEEALYALTDTGSLSEPVRTDFGYHIIKLIDVKQLQAPSFAETEERLRAELVREKSEAIYVEQRERLADISFSSADLAEPAEVLGLTIQQSAPFGRNGGADSITANPKVIKAAFGDEVLKDRVNSVLIDLDNSRAVVLHLKEHRQPRTRTLDEVAEQLRAELVESRAREQLKAMAQEKLAALRAGATMAEQAGELELVSREGVQRATRDLPLEVRTELFRMAQPENGASYASVPMFDGSYAVIALEQVAVADSELSDDERRSIQRVLASGRGQADYRAMLEQLKSEAEIERL
ncbi:SurA N-terminal domain-containing protein [Marinobacterium arenosum]|uniref:SurA N-terminal domain-containing protein n=1 Tax=Marinobacterium arenosum TaxID=2862496 RepID=UPI001C957719|nr:SurA N-terminal domain-containing protein [Marinobacterium arenosum]MBY4675274.1 SurA N-terminal domain-containing protein [Marinobacterium arenosum]